MRKVLSLGLALGVGAAATTAVLKLRESIPGAEKLDRHNHAGSTVSLIEGPALAAGAMAGILVGTDPPLRSAALLSTGVSAVLGAVDDLTETGSSKGLKGHFSAAARGTITTGFLKVAGISAAGIAAAALLIHRDERSWPATLADVVISGGVIAGSANLINLLDLRPGRALKAGLIASAIAEWRGAPLALLGAAAGPSAATWNADLAGRTMLGDSGANALGALLGTHAVATVSPRGRALLLALIVGATLASEKISFTTVIESTPLLRELDALGRTPARPGGS